ncbi:malonyl-CoA-acyl carrier protein-like protein transacylase [Tothia fuscella]|uniref:[acyl-carrier-protein] S-malonyltransferase n=1 Tax=Tothia fuscella TaxID=1048955 RepID=A0A9P4TZP1_9PEZI|nr:malonyl-CoA-acyl carrier protein-like protein transacylase [Tothia fuscella]
MRRWASSSAPRGPRTAIFFPGQGVQRVGMAKPWLEAFPRTVKPIFEEIDEVLGIPLTSKIESGTNAVLNATENSQPAIMATSIMILRVMEKEFGFKTEARIDFTLGHSLGEFAALVAGGYMSFQDALSMVRKRGEVMAKVSKEASEECGGDVGMVALVCENESHMQSLIDGITEFTALSSSGSKSDSSVDIPPVQQVVIANINSKNQIVLSGSIERIKTLLTHLRQFGGHDPRHVRLHSESPFHSPMMKPAQQFMRNLLDTPSAFTGKDIIKFPGTVPCISNVSARPFQSRQDLKDLLARQCTETVRWWESVRYLDQEEKVRRWIGIGPGKVGRNLVGKEVGMKGQVKGGGVWGITSPQEAEECIKALDETESVHED